MYLAIIVLPLLGSIVSGLLGRKVGVSGAQIITSSCVIITTILSIVTFFEVGINNIPVTIQLFRWIDSESLNVIWSFYFDSLTVSMLIPVLIVSSLVHIYSIGYMSLDPHNQRFFSYLNLFTLMMIILVTANNFLLMFLGWEGVGICSYLLVNFWYTRIAANQSSYSAFITNRVGDTFLTIGMFVLLLSFGNIDYATVFSLAPFINENIVTIIGICLLIGAMAKSSQVGLHVWLPMAMEGPTPVSALIHAATMVTAGVYLLMRSSPLIEYSSTVLILCLWIGAITTVFSSLIGLFQQDIKKVIAYSTMSQLGMMVIAVGLSSYNIALFHLVNHAFYKALLFLGAGSVIHAVADNQDLRKYGGLIPYLPLTYSVMLIASFSLVAFPFMTGFYSKDFIIESAYGSFYFSSTVVYFIAIIGAMLTTLYSVKVLYLTFLSKANGSTSYYYIMRSIKQTKTRTIYDDPWCNFRLYAEILNTDFISRGNRMKEIPSNHYPYYKWQLSRTTFEEIPTWREAREGNIFITLPLIILAIFSIFFGYITKDIFIGLGSDFFADNSLFVHPSHEILLDTEFAVPSLFKLLPLIFTIFLSAISIVFLEFLPRLLIYFKFSSFGYNIFSFFNQRFLIELFYNKYFIGFILKLGGHTSKVIDKGSVELLGPSGLESGLLLLSKNIASLDTGVITSYALYILVALIFYILLPYFYLSDNSLLLLIIFGLFTHTSYHIYNIKMQSYSFLFGKNNLVLKNKLIMIKNSNSLRKNNFVPKNKVNTIKKRTIGGNPVGNTITITAFGGSAFVYAIAKSLELCFIPFWVGVGICMGLFLSSPEDAHYVASQVADNAQSMVGQTDGTDTASGVVNSANEGSQIENGEAVGDNMDVDIINATGTGSVFLNSSNEDSQLVDHAESMPGLTATVGTGVYAGLAMGVANNVINSNSEDNVSQSDSSEESSEDNITEQLVYELRNTLNHVNRERRVNMSLLRDATNVLQDRANVLDRFLDVVADNFPDVLDQYTNVINSLRNISNSSASSNASRTNIIIDQAQNLGIHPVYVFEDLQHDLDLQAGNLENLIRRLDPNAEFSSDTDSEKINEAVQNHALRYPVRDNPSDRN